MPNDVKVEGRHDYLTNAAACASFDAHEEVVAKS